jgi:hypothetical protein
MQVLANMVDNDYVTNRMLGLLIGLGLAGSIANTYVIDQYKESQQKLLVAITQLQQSTDQVKPLESLAATKQSGC